MQTILPQNIGDQTPTDNNSNLPVIFEELEPLEIDPSSDYIFNNLYNPTNKSRTQTIDLVLHNNRYYARKTILYRERRFETTHLYNLHHRNIEHCLEFGVDEDNRYGYLYLEYMTGGNLASKITYFRENNMRLSELPLFNNVLDLVEGLYYLHTENILHRHIKPGNILIGRYDELVYCGFGLCCDATDECTIKSDGYLVGTGNYWSPEIIKSKTYNFESDIFSLGCVLYELYTMNVLFPGSSLDEVKNRILYSNPNYDLVMKRIPKLEELINGMTNKNAVDRFGFNRIYKCLEEWSKMSNLNIIVRNPFIIEEMNNNNKTNQPIVNNNNNNNGNISSVYPSSQSIQPQQYPLSLQQSIQPIQSLQQSIQPIQSLQQSIQPIQPLQQSIQPIQSLQQSIQPIQSLQQSIQPIQSLQQSLSQSIQPIQYGNPAVFNQYSQPSQQPQIFNAIPISHQTLQPAPLQQQQPSQQQYIQIIPNQTGLPQSRGIIGGMYNTQLPPNPPSYQPPTPPPAPKQQQKQQQQQQSEEIKNDVEDKEPFLQQQPSFTLPITSDREKTIIPCPVIPKKE